MAIKPLKKNKETLTNNNYGLSCPVVLKGFIFSNA